MRQALSDDLLAQYLGILRVTKRPPGLEALEELVSSHLRLVPFENVSKIYYWKLEGLKDIPDVVTYLDGLDRFHFGGTCYSNNYYFHLLLASLGYTVKLCGADMTKPDVHMVSMVMLQGREYLIDVGYAAPFLTPLPRDLATELTIELGHDRYVLKPQDADGCSRLELYRNGVRKHGYLAKPAPKGLEEFHEAIADSFRDDSTFLNALLLTRFYPDRALIVHNMTVIESQGKETRIQALNNRDELGQVVEQHFGIPRRIVMEAVTAIREFRDSWS